MVLRELFDELQEVMFSTLKQIFRMTYSVALSIMSLLNIK